MRASFTILVVILFALASVAGAGDNKVKKFIPSQKLYSNKVKLIHPESQVNSGVTNPALSGNKILKVRESAASYHRQIGISGNGYGWLNPSTRGLDRYVGDDTWGGAGNIDFLLAGFRDENAANITAVELDLTGANLATAEIYDKSDWGGTALNSGINPFGNGGRYPCVVALDKPLVAFNQYISGDVTNTPAISHPYLVTDYISWGANGGAWTSPDYIMDAGWLHPDVASYPPQYQYRQNRLWNGAVAVVKDAQDVYHYCGVYENWFSDPEVNQGKENDNYILTATSTDPSSGWTFGWTVGNNPVEINPQVVTLPRASVAMNSSGFGVILGPGHLGWHHPDSGYYYVDIRMTYSTTSNYGVTWSAWDTVSFGDLGFPLYHYAEDKLLIVSIIGNDTIWYEGPTFMGSNFDMDVIVGENNYIYAGFNALWGRPGDTGWYPSAYYSGKFMARKRPGVDWEAARIWYPNGAFEGDENPGEYFFDSEIDMALDEEGAVYAAWLDRRRTQVQVGELNRYADPATSGRFEEYKTDVYASRSLNGGADWSASPINITDSPSLDEYELNLAKSAATKDGGTVWVGYCIADQSGGVDPATDFYIALVNDLWISEGNDFNPPSAIADENVEPILRDYALDQNYPNPFNPKTRITFVPQQTGRAVLTVYSVDGQKVAEVFNGFTQKGIEYAVDFDGSNLAAGIYFYRLTHGKNVEVKKMALIK